MRRRRYTFTPLFAQGDLVTIAHRPPVYRIVQIRYTIRDVLAPYVEYGLIPHPAGAFCVQWEVEADLVPVAHISNP